MPQPLNRLAPPSRIQVSVHSEKGLRFYALVLLPNPWGGQQLVLRQQ